MENVIKFKIIPPNKGSKEDYDKKIWRVCFKNPEFPNKTKCVYFTEFGLRYREKFDTTDKEKVYNYLDEWAKGYLENNKFRDVNDWQKI